MANRDDFQKEARALVVEIGFNSLPHGIQQERKTMSFIPKCVGHGRG